MAHEEYTGKSAGTTITVGAASIPTGWRKITIEENGVPAPEPLDITTAGDAAYTYMDDPLGGKGQTSAKVTVEGFLSKTDFTDSGILSKALGSTANVIVIKKTGEDTWTGTSMIYQSFVSSAEFASVVPFTATYEVAASTGVWS